MLSNYMISIIELFLVEFDRKQVFSTSNTFQNFVLIISYCRQTIREKEIFKKTIKKNLLKTILKLLI